VLEACRSMAKKGQYCYLRERHESDRHRGE